jgi:chemotaxis protein CheY-P-specific phosphatase CheC
MDEQLEKTLSNIAIETFEKLAFLFAFPAEEADPGQPDSMVTASVSFAGSFSGLLIMKVSAESLPELAANMLGVDEDEETTSDQQHDALKETLNVICGNLLPAIAGNREVFNIGPPEIVAEGETLKKSNDRNPACYVKLILDDGPCDLFLFILTLETWSCGPGQR